MRQALCGRSQGCPVDEWTAVRLADLGHSTLTPGLLRHQSRVGCRAGASGGPSEACRRRSSLRQASGSQGGPTRPPEKEKAKMSNSRQHTPWILQEGEGPSGHFCQELVQLSC